MKKVMLVWLLLPVAALAQSAFDGTWKQRLDSIRITEKPEVFSIVNGTYICSSTKPEIKIMADGHDHTIMGDYTLAVTIVDAHTTRNTWKLAGKITDVTTINVSPDGSTISGTSTVYEGAEPASITYTEKRVAAGPPGAHAVSGSWQTVRINSGNDAQTIVSYEMSANSFRMRQGNGWSYDARFDGKEYPVISDPQHTTVTLHRIDDDTVQETIRSKGKVVEEIRLAVAKDGKTIEVEDHDLVGGLAGEQTTTYTLDKQQSSHDPNTNRADLTGNSVSGELRLTSYLINIIVLWGLVAFVSWPMLRRGITLRKAINARWSAARAVWRDLGIALLVLAGLFTIVVLGSVVFRFQEAKPFQRMAQMTPHTALERCVSIAVAISAGFCEEFIFRGYLQEQCRGLTGSAAAGVVLQAFSSARRTGIKAGRTW